MKNRQRKRELEQASLVANQCESQACSHFFLFANSGANVWLMLIVMPIVMMVVMLIVELCALLSVVGPSLVARSPRS